MIKSFFVALAFVMSFTVSVQAQVTKDDLVGSWKIVRMEIVKEGKTFITIEASGVVFSEEVTKSMKEDELALMRGMMEAAGKKVLGSQLIYTAGGDFNQIDTEGTEVPGTYKLLKGGKVLATNVNKDKNEYTPSIADKKLSLLQQMKNGEMILVMEKQ